MVKEGTSLRCYTLEAAPKLRSTASLSPRSALGPSSWTNPTSYLTGKHQAFLGWGEGRQELHWGRREPSGPARFCEYVHLVPGCLVSPAKHSRDGGIIEPRGYSKTSFSPKVGQEQGKEPHESPMHCFPAFQNTSSNDHFAIRCSHCFSLWFYKSKLMCRTLLPNVTPVTKCYIVHHLKTPISLRKNHLYKVTNEF